MWNELIDSGRGSVGRRRTARRPWNWALALAAGCMPLTALGQDGSSFDRFMSQGGPAGLAAPAGPGAPAPGLPAPAPMAVRPPVVGTQVPGLPSQIIDMPTAQADLRVTHRRSQLIIARSNVVRTAIADPSVVEAVQFQGNELSVIGLSPGSTSLTIWFENDPMPLIYTVHCVQDEDQRRLEYGLLERKLAALFPNSKVYLIPLSGKIVVKGQARDSEEASRILEVVQGEVINQLGRLGGPQPFPVAGPNAAGQPYTAADLASSYIVNMLEVPGEYTIMLRVRIAEINRTQLRQYGINLSALFDNGSQFVSSSMGGFPGTLTGIFEDGEIGVLLNALAGNGTAKILSEPTLTVLSGHPASFLSGQEFPVPTIVGVQGVGAQQTTFRGAGTSIVAIPTVIDKDHIRLQIVPEFSSINAGIGNNGVAGVDVRRVQTTVDLREGQTIAIAGLIHHQDTTNVARIPWLGDFHWFGPWLFSSKNSGQAESELLILVTPEIVRPMDAEEVPPLPGFESTVPDDCLFYCHNRTEGMPDLQPYQVAPLGTGGTYGIPVPYTLYNPAPAEPLYSPVPTNPYGASAPPQPLQPGPEPFGPPPSYGPPAGYRPAPAPAMEPSYPTMPRTPSPQYQSVPQPQHHGVPQRQYQSPPPAPAAAEPGFRPQSPVTGAGWSTAPGGARPSGGPIQQMSGLGTGGEVRRAEHTTPADPRRKLQQFGKGIDGRSRH